MDVNGLSLRHLKNAMWRFYFKTWKKTNKQKNTENVEDLSGVLLFLFIYPDEFVLFLNSVVQYTIGSVKQESGVTIQNQCKLLFTKRKSLILFGKAAKTRFLNSWLICFKCFNVCIQFCCNELWQTLDIFFKGVQYGIALNRV